MIITKTPNRCTLFGSSTDLKEWRSVHGGISVNFTINKFSWLAMKSLPPFFEYKSKFSYSEIECVKSHSEVQHRIIREALKYLNIKEGIDLSHMADIFSKSGLGSSSSFTVCLLNTLSRWKKIYWSKKDLAEHTMRFEESIGEYGCQDILSAVYGGLNIFRYYPDGQVKVEPLFLCSNKMNKLQSNMMLFFTGQSRHAREVSSKYAPTILEKSTQQFEFMRLAEVGAEALCRVDIDEIADVLNQTWEVKRQVSDVISNPQIDQYYGICRKWGAGFKLIGSGSGGSILVVGGEQDKIREELGLIEIPFKITHEGSTVLYHE